MSPILGIWASQNYSRYSLPTSYDSIATVTVGAGGASTITFNSIPQTYTHLQLRAIIKTTGGSGANMTFNNNTGTNYVRHRIVGNTSGVQVAVGTSLTSIPINANAGFADFGPLVLDILDYTNTNKNKVTRWLTGLENNTTASGIAFESGLWLNTNAITTITFTQSTEQYSHFALYGIKGA